MAEMDVDSGARWDAADESLAGGFASCSLVVRDLKESSPVFRFVSSIFVCVPFACP